MLGASCVFMSSFGYQTNLMALAAGGHSSRDFLRFGTPMQVLLAVISIGALIAGMHDNTAVMLVLSAVAGAVILGAPQVVEFVRLYQVRKEKKLAATK
jgi:hypothetical protein